MKILSILIITFSIFSACTENPFFEDKIDQDERSLLTGQVVLSDYSSPDSIYVWFEGLGYSTYTDEEGNFQFELPTSQSQPGGGINGLYNLYYYMGNYRYATSSILILNGKYEYGKGDLDDDGNVKGPVVLEKMLEIRTRVEPNKIEQGYNDVIDIFVTLENLVDTVIISSYKRPDGGPSGIIIKPLNLSDDYAILIRGNFSTLITGEITSTKIWQMRYKFSPGYFPEADYHFIPFLLVHQKGLPDELLNSIDPLYFAFSHEYLKIPFRQSPGFFYVTDDDNL